MLRVGRRFGQEATPEPQPIDKLVRRVAELEGVRVETAATVFWLMADKGYLGLDGRLRVELKR